MKYLKEKVDAGANFIFTQMFYDADMFIEWVHAARAAGITVPIVPGIMPIQTWNGFLRAATAIAKTIIPKSYLDALEPYKNNDEKVRELGTKLVADMCRKILAAPGVKGLHFYTMNLERGTRMLLEELNLVPRIETVKPFPWRQVRSSLAISPSKRTDRCPSPSHLRGGRRPFAPYSGRIAPSPTSPAQKTGMSTPTVGSGTHAVLRTVN